MGYMWMEALGGGKKQPIQTKGARSFEGKQTPQCFFLGCLFINNKSKDQIHDMPLPACLSWVQSDHNVISDLSDASEEPHPVMFLSTHLVAQWWLPACPSRREMPVERGNFLSSILFFEYWGRRDITAFNSFCDCSSMFPLCELPALTYVR